MKNVTKNLVKISELEGSIARLKEDVKAKKKEMSEEILPRKISKGIADFKAAEMAEDLKWARDEDVETFKRNELPFFL